MLTALRRPDLGVWTEARRVLEAAGRTADALTPAPPGRMWAPIAAEIDPVPNWSYARYRIGAAAEALSLEGLPRLTGATLVHTDLRDDNVIMGRDGRVWFCDWNFPTVGPAWVDEVTSRSACTATVWMPSSLLPDAVGPTTAAMILLLVEVEGFWFFTIFLA